MRLLEEYSVGQTLGEGAFGVVSNCKKRSTGEEFAVKMVDKVETPVDAIKKEAEMLQSMDHPNIVKFHGVYYERCFVCIVMDKYSGGDLVEGLQKHLKERGQINCHDVVHVARQMGAGIQYLHNRNVIHRDVKGDNYLMDRKDMTDPQCLIVLTDFGTACTIQPDERLSIAVGTKIFWAPEFFDKNYSQKVDVWAMGVVMYGLVSGRFPFRDETDIRTKEVKIPKRVHPMCEEFIKKMLEKKEASRYSSDAVMAHKWVATDQKGKKKPEARHSADASEGKDEEGNEDFRVDAANDGIKERRQELINRLNKEHEQNKQGGKRRQEQKINHAQVPHFTLIDKQGSKLVYEWWPAARVQKGGIMEFEGQTKPTKAEDNQDATASDLKLFSDMLIEHNINPKEFGIGKAKTLNKLAEEVKSGAARLMLDATAHKKLVRVVDIVLLRISSGNGGDQRLLIETAEMFKDGRSRETLRLPGTKKEPHENTRQTAERILQEMLNMSSLSVKFDLTNMERHEEETESPSYPGVRTVYRKEIVEGAVTITDTAALNKIGLPAFTSYQFLDPEGSTKTFDWMTDKAASAKGVKLKAEGGEAVSTLVRAPIGLAEDALREHLQNARIDVSRYGQPGTRSLKEFSAELIKGEATLMQDSGGGLVRVVDVVLLIVCRGKLGETLVQTEQIHPDGAKTILNRLPGAKRRPDENQFLSARRILRRQLEMDENMVVLDQEVRNVEEEKSSSSYPGLKTVYRKRLIKAQLVS
jgi:serine/threonine protein kinase